MKAKMSHAIHLTLMFKRASTMKLSVYIAKHQIPLQKLVYGVFANIPIHANCTFIRH